MSTKSNPEKSNPQKTDQVAMRALDITPPPKQTGYPQPFLALVAGREKRRLGDHFGLTRYGINLCRIKPGSVSSMRHCHSAQDEFVYVLEGSPTLVTNAGAMALSPGMCAGFKAGSGDAHHLRNDSSSEVWYLEIGDRSVGDLVVYPDDDLALIEANENFVYTHKNGDPY
jgi:uncharacterized cupin superfamily protein